MGGAGQLHQESGILSSSAPVVRRGLGPRFHGSGRDALRGAASATAGDRHGTPVPLRLLLVLSRLPGVPAAAQLLSPLVLPPGVGEALRANGRLVKEALSLPVTRVRSTPDSGSSRELARSYARSRIAALRLLSGHPPPVRLQGASHVERALAGRRGVLILSAHIGSWELGAVSLTRFAAVHSVAGIQMRPDWTESLRKRFHDFGIRIHSPRRALLSLSHALGRGEIVALQLDGDQGGRRPAQLLGRRMLLPAGAAWLAATTDCTVLPAACVWVEGNWVAHIAEPLSPPPDAPMDAISAWHDTLAREMEKMIMRWPEQWVLPSPLAARTEAPGTEA